MQTTEEKKKRKRRGRRKKRKRTLFEHNGVGRIMKDDDEEDDIDNRCTGQRMTVNMEAEKFFHLRVCKTTHSDYHINTAVYRI